MRLLLLTASLTECSLPFQLIQGACYSLSPSRLKWVDGERYCEGQNAQLATFDHMDNFSAVKEQFFHATAEEYFWIGYHQIGHKGLYKGVDGSTDFPHHWEYSQPDNKDSLRDCVMVHKNGRWYADQCKQERLALCKLGSGKVSQCKYTH
jgi:hypothetical protein